jgi:hypothetical protein
MRYREKILVFTGSLVSLVLAIMIFPAALTSEYKIPRSVLDTGGGERSSFDYRLIDATGQTTVQVSVSSSYTLKSGFLLSHSAVGIGEDSGNSTTLPKTYALKQNYPNPFNPSTTIGFEVSGSIGEKQHVEIVIYDLRGRHVNELIDSDMESGTHTVHWDGRNYRGEPVVSGIYLYRLKVGGEAFIRKMTVLK